MIEWNLRSLAQKGFEFIKFLVETPSTLEDFETTQLENWSHATSSMVLMAAKIWFNPCRAHLCLIQISQITPIILGRHHPKFHSNWSDIHSGIDMCHTYSSVSTHDWSNSAYHDINKSGEIRPHRGWINHNFHQHHNGATSQIKHTHTSALKHIKMFSADVIANCNQVLPHPNWIFNLTSPSKASKKNIKHLKCI